MFPRSRANKAKPDIKKSAQRLSSQHRLHYHWEFRKFFDQSEVFRLGECVIFRAENGQPHFRLGITLKARGRSVDRNRVKRVIREAFRILGPILGAFDYNVVIPATKKLGYPYPEKLRRVLNEDFKNALARR